MAEISKDNSPPAGPLAGPPAGPLSVIWHRRAAEIPANEWERLFAAGTEGQWWHSALDSGGLQDQFEFYYGQVRQGAAVVGIIPTFVMDVPMELVAPPEAMKVIRGLGPLGKPLLKQRTLFVGNVAGEGGAVGLAGHLSLARVGVELHQMVWKLRRKTRAKLVVWKDFPHAEANALAGPLARAGYFRLPSYPATEVSLPADGALETYFKALSGDYRYKLKKKLKAGAAIPLRAEHLRTPTPAERKEIWALFWQTYERGETKFEKFHPGVFDRFADHPASHWLLLRREDTHAAVAFMLLTEEPTHWVNRFIGMDYAQPKELFLYYRLFVEALSICATSPKPHLLSGQTGYRPKLELGHHLLPLDNFTKHRNPLMHWIYAKVAAGINWATLDSDLATYLKAHPEEDASRRGW